MASKAHGIYEGTALADKTFHGFRLDPNTSDLNVEIINDGTTVVSIPDNNTTDPTAYKHWFWSADTITFRWGDNGHLLMEMI